MPAPHLDLDAPLQRLAPTGGWTDGEPRKYYVRARHAEEAVTLAIFVAYVRQGAVPRKHAGRSGVRSLTYPCPDGRSKSLSARSPARTRRRGSQQR